MENPESGSLIKPHFFQPLLPGFHNHLNIPERFFKKHIAGRHENKMSTLRSDVSHRTWEVKMDGQRLTDGWKEFVVDHDFRIGDIIVFRHEGDMVFHVKGFGPSFCNLQYASSRPDNAGNSDGHNKGNVLRKKKPVNKNRKTQTKSSTDYTCFDVTASNLRLDKRFVPIDFARSNGLNNRWCKIVLMNEHGSSWTLDLGYRKYDGLVYITRGWSSFCNANGLEPGSYCNFKMVRNGTKPVLHLCSTKSSNNCRSQEECSEAEKRKTHSTKPRRIDKSSSRKCSKRKEKTKTLPTWRASSPSGKIRFVTLRLTSYSHKTGQLRLPTQFTRLNGIKESGEITLLDKYGVEWPSYLRLVKGRGWFYMTKGCKNFCKANGVKKGKLFTLELIWEDTTPILKFCSKTRYVSFLCDTDHDIDSPEHEENQQETAADINALKRKTSETAQPPRTAEESPTETKTGIERVRGPILDPPPENRSKYQGIRESSRGTRSDLMPKAKQSIGDALTTLRQFREVLMTKEQNLEALLREFDDLGEAI